LTARRQREAAVESRTQGEEAIMQMDDNFARRVMWVIWPAFLVAAIAEAIFFTVFDPFELHFFGAPLEVSREVIYTMGFFGFWALGIASSGLTAFLER